MHSGRRFVPFEALWEMAIAVPYSFLVREGDLAWSCGQLALDQQSKVMKPGDLTGQSEIVAQYISQIIARGELASSSPTRLLLYYVDDGPDATMQMCGAFRRHFGDQVLLDLIPVPHYYYPGVMLEVDVFCDEEADGWRREELPGLSLSGRWGVERQWLSVECDHAQLPDLPGQLAKWGLEPENCLSDHWVSLGLLPEDSLHELKAAGWITDPGALVVVPPERTTSLATDRLHLRLLMSREQVSRSVQEIGDCRIDLKRQSTMAWLQARSLDESLGLVDQTKAVMAALEIVMKAQSLTFSDVVKSTTQYRGKATAEDLHDNMAVRNAYYQSPGPASTGLPVFGFNDPVSLLALDLTLLSGGSPDNV